MTLKKWFYLFWTTLVIGMGASLLVGLIINLIIPEFSKIFIGSAELTTYSYVLVLLSGGAILGGVSHAVFFCYLIVNYFALSMLRNKSLWQSIQILLIFVVLIDFGYLVTVYNPNVEVINTVLLPFILLFISLITALYKIKQTNKTALVPTLFFMCAATFIALLSSIKHWEYLYYLVFSLSICNAWQILNLHKLLNAKLNLTKDNER